MQLFHISESPDIQQFAPRPAPAYAGRIHQDVVFAIHGDLLHNYLLPRDCPRVTFYRGEATTQQDQSIFLGLTAANYVVAVESRWLSAIASTTLFCYEFPAATFQLLDKGAGYYISYEPLVPVSMRSISNPLAELLNRSVEVRFCPDLMKLADAVSQSSLNFSLIRMRNAVSQPYM